jgi:apolipoprotein N-acyltransferase
MNIKATSYKITSAGITAILLASAAPPYDIWPFAFIGLIPLYFVIKELHPLKAGLYAWFSGWVVFMIGCPWWIQLLQNFAGLSFPAALGLMILFCAYQALVFAIWAVASRFLEQRYNISAVLAGPVCFALAEYCTPFFMKMYLGITVWQVWPVTQAAEIGGVPAVSALIVLSNILIAESLPALIHKKMPAKAVRYGVLVFSIILIAGTVRSYQVAQIAENEANLKIGVVQPNFGILPASARKTNGLKYIKTLQKAYRRLSANGAELIVWPETAWPYPIEQNMQKEYPAGHPWSLRPDGKGRLLFGTLTRGKTYTGVQNSAVLVSENGDIAGRYDKQNLFPFGEYIPLAVMFPKMAAQLRNKMPEWPDISRGQPLNIIKDKNLRIGVLICSEDISISSGLDRAALQPDLLVSLASDAWFGNSAAPAQHTALASFRAVETRRTLVRCANNGVTAIIDASGRIALKGQLADTSSDKPVRPSLYSANVALLNIFSAGLYTIKLFPVLLILLLIISIALSKRACSKRLIPYPITQRSLQC